MYHVCKNVKSRVVLRAKHVTVVCRAVVGDELEGQQGGENLMRPAVPQLGDARNELHGNQVVVLHSHLRHERRRRGHAKGGPHDMIRHEGRMLLPCELLLTAAAAVRDAVFVLPYAEKQNTTWHADDTSKYLEVLDDAR